MSENTRHYLISGRVQGVGFRAFARRCALALGLKGWTRNLKDRRVEVLARGESEKLDLFEAKLKIGPIHGNVEEVVVTNQPQWESGLTDFDIQKDGENPWSNNG